MIEVESVQALFNGALALAYQPLPAGNRIAIVTNAGGPAALAADALEGAGLRLARTSAETQAALRSFLHPRCPGGRPGRPAGRRGRARTIARRWTPCWPIPACDGVLAILVPQALVNPVAVVRGVRARPPRRQSQPRKPVLACLMGEASLDAAFTRPHTRRRSRPTPSRRTRWRRSGCCGSGRGGRLARREAADRAHGSGAADGDAEAREARREVQTAIRLARASGRRALDAAEARAVAGSLRHRHARPSSWRPARTRPRTSPRRIGFPVALKLISPDILHKTDIGGVILNVPDEAGGQRAASRPSWRAPGRRIPMRTSAACRCSR